MANEIQKGCPFYQVGETDLHSFIAELKRQNDIIEQLLERDIHGVSIKAHLITVGSVVCACIGTTAAMKALALL